MARYGTSLDIGAELEAETKQDEAIKQKLENDAKPIKARPSTRKSIPPSDEPLPVKIGEDWPYLVGAIIIMALLVGVGWYLFQAKLHPQSANTADQSLPAATAEDVGDQLDAFMGRPADSSDTVAAEPAVLSNHSMNST